MSNLALTLTYRDAAGAPTLPLPTQIRFHGSAAEGRLLSAGYGYGKTNAGAMEAALNLIRNPGCNGLLVAPFYSTLESVMLPAFLAAVPEGLRERLTQHRQARYFDSPFGARIYYRSAEDPRSMEGLTVAWEWGDEARYWSIDAFEKFSGRRRQTPQDGGPPRFWLTSTPEMGWLHDEFCRGKLGREWFKASTRENVYLPPSYIESLRVSFSERKLRQIIDGEFVISSGAVYGDEYEPSRHLVEWTYSPDHHVICFWDFGRRRPYVGFAQVLLSEVEHRGRRFRRGDAIVFDELVLDDISTEAMCERIKAKRYRLDGIYCDPAGDATQSAMGLSDIDMIRRAGLPQPRFVTRPELRHIPHGVARLAARLRNAAGETSLYFDRALDRSTNPRGIIRSLETYRYPEDKVGDHPLKDGISDHAMDALRYFVLNSERQPLLRAVNVR